jgi:transcriptional regulator with XRE-family HTH domain
VDRQETGQRIAQARRRRGLSQATLAGLVGRSESWLSQVERGKRSIDSHTVLTHLAQVLRMDIGELAEPGTEGTTRLTAYPSASQIEQAMTSYTGLDKRISNPATRKKPDLRNLQHRIRAAHRLYQAARYEEAGRLLPAIIAETETASRAADPADRGLCRQRTNVYDTTAALLSRVGERGLAWVAADRAISAAEQSGQPLMVALGAYRMAYILTSRKRPDDALGLATAAAATAIARLRPPPLPEQLSIYGGLHLAAANAAAARYGAALSASLLSTAGRIAGQLGRDANFLGTAFGPVNVAIHKMSVSARLGDWAAVLRIGESLDAAAMPAGLIGRRTQVKLDLARAYAMRRQDSAAVNTLLSAEQLSPQLVRFHNHTHDIIHCLLRREHRASTPQLRPLAHRAGLI